MSDLLMKHASMAGAGPIDASPMPWPMPMLPAYQQTGRVGKYRMTRLQVGMVSGYYRGTHPAKDPIWALFCRDRSVDRIDEMNLESYAPHIAAARGHVLLIGMGMGVMLTNLLMKSDVTQITVMEPRRTEALFLLKNTSMRFHMQFEKKVKHLCLGEAEVHRMKVDAIPRVDHMFVEGQIGSMNTMRLVAKTVKNTKPAFTSWKGMEIDYVDWLHQAHVDHGREVPITSEHANDSGNLREWVSAARRYNVNPEPITSLTDWGRWAHKAVKNVTVY